jgi:hypothetical protein
MAVATYKVTTHLPEMLRKELPSQKQMESLFELKEAIFQTPSGKLEKSKVKSKRTTKKSRKFN